jgi:hypothetical protein
MRRMGGEKKPRLYVFIRLASDGESEKAYK